MEDDRDELEAWADLRASDLVADVERHGVSITTGEARWRLLSAVALIQAPLYALDDGGEWTHTDPARGGPDSQVWRHPGFVGEVAAGTVHFAGRAYFPADPATSSIGIALPWDLAAELVMRLSSLLSTESDSGALRPTHKPTQDLALLIVSLSSSIADELCWVDDDIVNDAEINGRRYLLVRACDAWRAAAYRQDATGDSRVDLEHPRSGHCPDKVDGSDAASADHTFLWELDTWINAAGHQNEQNPQQI